MSIRCDVGRVASREATSEGIGKSVPLTNVVLRQNFAGIDSPLTLHTHYQIIAFPCKYFVSEIFIW